MKKLLFLFTMLALFVACSDDDKDNELPIKGLEIPKFDNPVKPGESITIKGEGFTKASEIWFRTIITRAENAGDVKAIVTGINSTGITFTAPEVYGNQSVLLKENGKEYELGKMTFEEQPEESGDVEILPKKITKVIFHEEEYEETTYEYSYNQDGQIISVRRKGKYDDYKSTYTYSTDKIVMVEKETTEGRVDTETTFDLKDGKLSHYKSTYDEFFDEYTYGYNGEYLSNVEGREEVEDGKMSETFSFIQGKLMQYKYTSIDYDYVDIMDFTYGSQLNNLNIDLWTFISYDFEGSSVEKAFLLGIVGKRSQYLPASMKWTTEDDEDGLDVSQYNFNYKMDGDYITEVSIIEDNETIADSRFEIFYED